MHVLVCYCKMCNLTPSQGTMVDVADPAPGRTAQAAEHGAAVPNSSVK